MNWTRKQQWFVRDHYRRVPVEDIARALGRTASQVRQCAKRIGAARRRILLQDFEARLRRLHAQGVSDWTISKRLKIAQATASKWLRRLGLKANGQFGVMSPAARELWKESCRAAAQALGADSLTELMHARRRVRYLSQEPGCVSKSEVAVMRALRAADAPLSVSEIVRASGAKAHSVRYALASLMKFGGVRCLAGRPARYATPRARRRGGYRLADGAGCQLA